MNSVGTVKSPDKIRRKLYSGGALQKRQKRLISAEGTANFLPKLNDNLTKNEIINALKNMKEKTCHKNAEKYHILRRRDELLSKLREIDTTDKKHHKVTQGTCQDMCPEKERYMRDLKKNVHFYECDSQGQMVPEKMVKDYSRSAADQDMPLAHELRSLEALQMTMDYLIFNIANEIPNTNTELSRWYDFLWSRTRAIRKDITQQMLNDETAVDLVEKCARLHIFASFKLSFLESDLFDHKINTENLSKSMQTLRHMYEDLAKKQRYCANESEFRSYDIILNLSDCNVHSQVLSYRSSVRESSHVQLALNLASALQNNNYVRFFRLVQNQASFLQACICYQFFTSMRSSALKVICMAYHIFPLENLVDNLAFDSTEQALSFLKAFKVELDATDPNQINAREARIILNSGEALGTVPHINCEWIERKANNLALSQILCNNPLAVRSFKQQLGKKVLNSFAGITHAYSNDPVVNSLLESHGLDVTTMHTKQNDIFAPQPRHTLSSKKPVPSDFSFARLFQNIQPKPQKQSTAQLFPMVQQEIMIERIVTSQLNSIALSCYESIIQSRFDKIRKNLQRERLRRFARQWILFTQSRKYRHRVLYLATNLADTLFCEIIHVQVYTISENLYREAKQFFRQRLATEIAVSSGDELIEEIVSTQLYSIACRVRANQVKDIQKRLEQIRLNLHRKWLRQFTNHWLSVTRRNRVLRSITFLPAIATTPAESSFFLSPSRRLFRPNLKKLTPEKMREMVEQKLKRAEEAEKRKLEGLVTNHQGVEDAEVSMEIAIRDEILDGVCFAESTSLKEFDASTSNLRLFKPGVKRITPEGMHKMVEQRKRFRSMF